MAKRPGSDDRDYVDQMLEDWRAERPDLDLSPLSVIGRISRISRHFDREIARTFRAYGLSSWGFYVLAALGRSGPPYELTPTQLYRSLLVSSGLMTSRIARLEQAGLVKRVPDPGDGRGVLVKLTGSGRRLLREVLEEHNRREAEMLSPLTAREREKVAAALRKLLVAAGICRRPNTRDRLWRCAPRRLAATVPEDQAPGLSTIRTRIDDQHCQQGAQQHAATDNERGPAHCSGLPYPNHRRLASVSSSAAEPKGSSGLIWTRASRSPSNVESRTSLSPRHWPRLGSVPGGNGPNPRSTRPSGVSVTRYGSAS